ncbi:hypothetical protein D3C80_1825270 [compost metagenome]
MQIIILHLQVGQVDRNGIWQMYMIRQLRNRENTIICIKLMLHMEMRTMATDIFSIEDQKI